MGELESVLLFPHCFQNTQIAKSRAKGAIDDRGPGVPPSNPVTSVSFPFQRKLLIPEWTLCSQPRGPPESGSLPSTARAPSAQEGESQSRRESSSGSSFQPLQERCSCKRSAARQTSILPSRAPHYSARRARTRVPCLTAHLPPSRDNPASAAGVLGSPA